MDWNVGQKMEHRISVAEMRILIWMCGVIKEVRIRNEYISSNVEATSIVEKMKENRFGHVTGKLKRR